MAVTFPDGSPKGTPSKHAAVDVTITSDSTLDTLVRIPIREGFERLQASIENGSAEALAACEVSFQLLSDANNTSTYQVVANATSDFTTDITWPLIGAGTDFTALDSDAAAVLSMEVKGMKNVLFKASTGNASDTLVSVYWQVR